jgi:hypothetical protein
LAFWWITDENNDKFNTTPGTSADNGSGCLRKPNKERYHYTSFSGTRQRRIILKGTAIILEWISTGPRCFGEIKF